MFCWKIAPALATGNTIIIKLSELTALTALRMASFIADAGFPPGVVNILVGYDHAATSHMRIDKVAFTGSTLTGRKVMEAAAKSNLKNVMLELGGKSPNVIFASTSAGSRIYVQSGEVLKNLTDKTRSIKVGDPFTTGTYQGPQVSQIQFDRIMGYVESGRAYGANVLVEGERHGTNGYFIQPTIFTHTRPDMKIVREGIFVPLGVVIKFHDEEDVIRQANDTMYGLAAAIFSKSIDRAIRVAHRLKAGTAWVNCINYFHPGVPFGGFKQSGIGRELGEYALSNYTNVKAVVVNIGHRI